MIKNTQISGTDIKDLITAFEQVSELVIIINPDNQQIIGSSPSAQKFYSYSEEEFTNLTISDISADPKKFNSSINSFLTDRLKNSFENYQLVKGGSAFLIEFKLSQISNGNINAVFCIGKNSDERTAEQKELIKSVKKYRMLVEGINVITWLYDLKHLRYIYVSRVAEDQLGYPLEKWFEDEHFWFNIIHPEDKEKVISLTDERITHGLDFELEYRVIAADGSIKWFRDLTSVNFTDNKPDTLQGVLIDVTDKKKAEEALKKSEEQLYMIFDNSNVGNSLTSTDGRFLRVNKALCEMLGYTSEELLKINFKEITHPDDLVQNLEILQKTLESNASSFEMNKRYIAKDGRIISAITNISILKDENGNPSRLVAQVKDITAQKASEEKLRVTEHRLSSLLNNLSDIVFYESDTNGVFISENIEEMVGYPSKDFAADNYLFEKLMHPEDSEKINKQIKSWQVENNPHSLNFEFRVRKKDGSYIWIEDHMFGVNSSNRSYWSGFMIDVTNRKMAEMKLEETQMRLSSVLNNLPNVVIYENATGKQFISENIIEMLGFPVEEFYNNSALFDSLIHKNDVKRILNSTQKWYKSGAKGTYKETFRIKRKDGDYIWIEDHMFKTLRQDGLDYYSGVMIDITERKNIEEQLAGTVKEKELLIKEIHHRVKNNLQVVSSLLKLQSTYIKDKEARDMLLDSQNRVQSMALVHKKLYQSKDLANINLNEYIPQLLHHLMNSFKSKSDRIMLNMDIKDITMGIDTVIPCGLIINELVSNSLKHAFANDSRGKIDIELSSDEKNVYTMKITDNGTGFPEKVDFRNTASLGLQLVMTLVNQIDGNIELLNSSGTSFVITFKEVSGN